MHYAVRNRLDVADKLEWMSHPLSGYLLKVFCDAFELGRVWGCIMLEHLIKQWVLLCTRLWSASKIPALRQHRAHSSVCQ